MGDKLYIVIPAYNEEENIEAVIRDWHPVVETLGADSRLVIINDGSKDSTYEKMLALKNEFPFLEPLTKANSGHGATILYGYNYIIVLNNFAINNVICTISTNVMKFIFFPLIPISTMDCVNIGNSICSILPTSIPQPT